MQPSTQLYSALCDPNPSPNLYLQPFKLKIGVRSYFCSGKRSHQLWFLYSFSFFFELEALQEDERHRRTDVQNP